MRDERPGFDRAIPPSGYQWFYLDGLSADGACAVVVIALLGNPFSPVHARARRAGPLAFSAMNVAVYARARSCWALTERAIEPKSRSFDALAIGDSSMRWEGDRLLVELHERAPWTGRRIEGRLTFTPHAMPGRSLALDDPGRHLWWPIAPSGDLDVDLRAPDLRFRGRGYLDANAGAEPLEAAFRRWTWARAHASRGRTIVTYDLTHESGANVTHALVMCRDGVESVHGLEAHALDRSRWRIARHALADAGTEPRIVRPLEDTPFYARDLVEATICGERVHAMHETLSVERLSRSAVRFLLGFRMRRR